jgi:hypothetical protein
MSKTRDGLVQTTSALSYVVVDRDGKFIKDFGKDNIGAQEFAIEYTGDCMDMGIDWDYRVAEIVEAQP